MILYFAISYQMEKYLQFLGVFLKILVWVIFKAIFVWWLCQPGLF